MPIYHCQDCHHEWEGTEDENECTWCDGGSYVLSAKSALELMGKIMATIPGYQAKVCKLHRRHADTQSTKDKP